MTDREAQFALVRLRVEMFAAAQLMHGDALTEFWQLVDDINAIRPAQYQINKEPVTP